MLVPAISLEGAAPLSSLTMAVTQQEQRLELTAASTLRGISEDWVLETRWVQP